MNIVKLKPRGYCHGVVDALKAIRKIDQTTVEKPIYILGMLVHNKEVNQELKQKGMIVLDDQGKTRMDLLNQIKGKGTLILTAHGTGPSVIKKAKEKGLHIIDTTCSDVSKTKDLILDYLNQDYDILYIGKDRHPESEAILDLNPNRIHLISSKEDIKNASLKSDKILVTNQTTMSFYNVFYLTEEIKRQYPNVQTVDELCDATRVRQEAVANQASDIDFCFVVGDRLSNNSNNLVKISEEKANIKAKLIEHVKDIDLTHLKTLKKVSVTSGASTPTYLTNQVIQYLEQFDKNDPKTWKKYT